MYKSFTFRQTTADNRAVQSMTEFFENRAIRSSII